jgi:hypothetical protein
MGNGLDEDAPAAGAAQVTATSIARSVSRLSRSRPIVATARVFPFCRYLTAQFCSARLPSIRISSHFSALDRLTILLAISA